MSSHSSWAAVVAVLLATLWSDRDITSAAPQNTLIFVDSRTPAACNCVLLTQCPSLRSLPGRRLTRQQVAVLQRAQCGFEGRNIKVCCPDTGTTERPAPTSSSTTTSSTSIIELPLTCGMSTAADKIFGGTDAALGGHPWMVALGYRDSRSFDGRLSILCGGSLVTSQHVITAAHCIHPSQLGSRKLSQLNVGDWNTATDPDCQKGNVRVCAPPVIVRQPSVTTLHPEYNSNGKSNNDIAIIRMDKPVPFGPFVQPICIPDSFDPRIPDPSAYARPLATGWGLKDWKQQATILQEVRLPFVDIRVCNASWEGALRPGQLCAGGEADKDTCKGDSGGPLVTSGRFGPPYKLVGLTSFGKGCGNKDNFGVYTSVADYRGWILASLTV